MNAINLLEFQHRRLERTFTRIENAKDLRLKTKLFGDLADQLAMHAAIEQHHFYPALRARRAEDILLESLEEPVGIKRVLADLIVTNAGDETFDAKIKVLKEQVAHHFGEEEKDLFPKAKKVLDAEQLEALGQEMSAEQGELEAGQPRDSIPEQTEKAAPL